MSDRSKAVAGKKTRSMMVYSPDKSELMEITSLETRNGDLIIKGKIMGSMPMTAIIKPEQARRGLVLLNMKVVGFFATFLFRKS